MKLRNRRDDAIEIRPVDHPVIEVEANGVFEVDDELGKNLLLQEDNYERVDEKPSRSKKDEEA